MPKGAYWSTTEGRVAEANKGWGFPEKALAKGIDKGVGKKTTGR